MILMVDHGSRFLKRYLIVSRLRNLTRNPVRISAILTSHLLKHTHSATAQCLNGFSMLFDCPTEMGDRDNHKNDS